MAFRMDIEKKDITYPELVALLETAYQDSPLKDSKKSITTALHEWGRRRQFNTLLEEAGYSSVLTNIDFSKLPQYLYHFITEFFSCNNIKFNFCKVPIDLSCNNCVFVNCNVIDNYALNNIAQVNCLFLVDDEESKEELIRLNINNSGNVIICKADPNPVIGVVYYPEHGTFYTDKIIEILKEHKFNIVNLHDTNHLLLQDMLQFDGFVLPGGPNIIQNQKHYTEREKLESLLISAALENKTPTLGVCRGHEFIGRYFGAKIKNLEHPESHGPKSTIHIPAADSMLFNLAEKKFTSQTYKRKREELKQEKDKSYSYNSVCAHQQGLFFNNGKPPRKRPRVMITAKADDGLPESLQVGENIISFQHHHEGLQMESFPKAAMRMFVNMVIDYKEHKQAEMMRLSF